MEPETNPLDSFITQLLAEQQFKNLEPEVQEQLKKDLYSRAEDHINAALLNELSEEDKEAFEKLLDDPSPVVAQTFLQEHVPDIEQVVAAALLKFRSAYLGS